jgi:hypothetical protein
MASITIHKRKFEIYIYGSDLFSEPQTVFLNAYLSSTIERLMGTLKATCSKGSHENFPEFVFLQLLQRATIHPGAQARNLEAHLYLDL